MKNHKGKQFYLEFNVKLYRYLMKHTMDALCAIDLDTIVPVYLASKKKGILRMYDAHEFFTEMIEVKRRPHIHFIWKKIETSLLPKFKHGYTVGHAIAKEFKELYGVDYAVVRNVPFTRPLFSAQHAPSVVVQSILKDFDEATDPTLPIILYQGAINEGRSLPELIKAMQMVPARLLLAGSGNFEEGVKEAINLNQAGRKVYLCGNVAPADLWQLTAYCFAGITIFDALSKNQYYSLGNKFFDYIMAQKPQVCVYYPEYAAILEKYPVAVPLSDTKPATIACCLNNLLQDPVLYENLQNKCKAASQELNWETEEQILFGAWQKLFLETK